jgi:hypothetical protein
MGMEVAPHCQSQGCDFSKNTRGRNCLQLHDLFDDSTPASQLSAMMMDI